MDEKILALAVIAKDEASATLARVEGNLNNLGIRAGTVDDAFKGVSHTLLGLGAATAAFAATAAATGFLKDSVSVAIALEASESRLRQSLLDNVPAWNGDMAAVSRATEARSQLGFRDIELQQSQAFLVGATHDVNKALDVQAVAMDLARFKGIDLQTASEALVKVEAGRFRLLQSLGINIRQGASAEEALTAVRKIAAGQAEAYGNTTAGAMSKADEAVYKLQEDIGQKLDPAVRDAANWVRTDLVPTVEAAFTTIGDLGTGIGDLADRVAHLGGAGGGRSPLADAIDSITGAWRTATGPGQQWYATVTAGATAAKAQAHATDAAAHSAAAAVAPESDLAAAIGKAQDSADAAKVTAEARTIVQIRAAAADAAYERSQWQVVAAENADIAAAKLLQQATGNAGDAAAIAAVKFATLADAEAHWRQGTRTAQDAFDSGLGGTPGGPGGMTSADYYLLQLDQVSQVTAKIRTSSSGVAAALRTETSGAFSEAKTAADRFFDSVHQANLRAIDDAHKRASEEISAERRSVDAKLAERKKLDAAPVTAAEKALRDAETGIRRRDLQEALVNAQQGGDTKAIRSANEALAIFEEQQGIDSLREAQSVADAQAQQDHDTAVAALNAKQKNADATATLAKTHENDRYTTQKRAFDDELKLVETHLLKVKANHQRVLKEIEDLYGDFHVGGNGGPSVKVNEATHTIIVNLDGKTLARVVDQHLFGTSRVYQPAAPGEGF